MHVFYGISQHRSSRLEVLHKKSTLRNFGKFTGKHQCQSLFSDKVAGLRHEKLIRSKSIHHACFLWNFPAQKQSPGGSLQKKELSEILENSQENTCARVYFLIKPQACNFIKKETLAQVYSFEFSKISPSGGCFCQHFFCGMKLRYLRVLLEVNVF